MEPIRIPQAHMANTGSTFVNFAVTPDDRLRELTYKVVLTEEPEGLTARIYRTSSTAPKHLSCDVHRWVEEERRWLYWKKEPQKYAEPPSMPADFVRTEIDGFEVWTATPLNDEQIQKLRERIFILRSSMR